MKRCAEALCSLAILLLFAAPARADLTFLSPIFERFDVTEMEALHLKLENAPTSVDRDLDLGLLELALGDYYEMSGAPHRASDYRNVLSDRCRGFENARFERFPEKIRGRAGYLCALDLAYLLGQRLPWVELGLLSRVRHDMKTAQLTPLLDQDEAWYVDGRLYAILPPGSGQDFKRALVALVFLERTRPDLSSPSFWLGRAAQLQRNEGRAKEQYAKALSFSPPDARARFYFDGVRLLHRRTAVDGILMGFSPRLFYTAALGFGAGLEWADERLGDKLRGVHTDLWGSTRADVGVEADYSDAEVFPGYVLGARGAFTHGVQDFYALGMSSRLQDHTVLGIDRSFVSIDVTEPFLEYFALRLGWQGASLKVRNFNGPLSASSLPDADASFFGGPVGELAFDSRDSRFDPRRGARVAVTGFFPTATLGSPRTFEEVRGEARGYLPWGYKGSLEIAGVIDGVEDDAPYAFFPTLSGSFSIPGVRDFRYQDRKMAAVFTELKRVIRGPFSLLGFMTAGTVTPGWTDLVHGAWTWGGGTGFELALSRFTRPRLRVEAGVFGGEFTLKAATSVSF